MREGRLIVIRFGELWLRGKNRNEYVSMLVRNINSKLHGERFALERNYDSIVLRPEEGSFGSALGRLGTLFGISAYEVAYEAEPRLASITKTALAVMKKAKGRGAFRINAHRAYKQHSFDSVKVVRRLAALAEKQGMGVSPRRYSREINISIGKDVAYISTERFRGLGGLPVGSSGRCVVLFSGGIDSPVAAWMAMKRGLEPVYVHMHAFPDSSEAESSKIGRLIGILSRYHGDYKTYYLPTHRFQVAALGTGRYELLMIKRFMLKAAERIAKIEKSSMIVTGESLGQVASQTQENLYSEEQGIDLSIIRPLICFDKSEIVELAKRIGTFDESVKEYRDVCSITARYPVIHSDPKTVKKIEKSMRMQAVVSSALKASKVIESNALD